VSVWSLTVFPVVIAAALGVAGCGTPVAVPPPEPADPACAAAAELLPERISRQERRTTEPESVGTAAWGDPPVVWRCGVPQPEALRPDSNLFEINGITWFAEELTRGYRFTTRELTADVEVTVPQNYAPEANVLLQLGPALTPLKSPG